MPSTFSIERLWIDAEDARSLQGLCVARRQRPTWAWVQASSRRATRPALGRDAREWPCGARRHTLCLRISASAHRRADESRWKQERDELRALLPRRLDARPHRLAVLLTDGDSRRSSASSAPWTERSAFASAARRIAPSRRVLRLTLASAAFVASSTVPRASTSKARPRAVRLSVCRRASSGARPRETRFAASRRARSPVIVLGCRRSACASSPADMPLLRPSARMTSRCGPVTPIVFCMFFDTRRSS